MLKKVLIGLTVFAMVGAYALAVIVMKKDSESTVAPVVPQTAIELTVSEYSLDLGSSIEYDSAEVASVKDGKIIYSGAGSSSCRPVIDKASIDGQGIYVLQVKQFPGNTPCTMDLSIFMQTIAHKDGTPIPSDAKILIDRNLHSE